MVVKFTQDNQGVVEAQAAPNIANYLEPKLKSLKSASLIATVLGLLIPGIMAAQNWDDHDRSDRYFSVDSAKNYLNSCAPNAILFTGGDNDTFPLWYAQEVEGVRTDVRVIVLSYFNTDWYIEQMERQAYKSAPLPFSLTKKQYYQGGPNDILPYVENPQIKGMINLEQYLKLVREDHQGIKVQSKFGSYNSIPSKQFFMNVDTATVKKMGIIPENKLDNITDQMIFTMKRGSLEKNTLMILDLIANNHWERPIYFNHTSLNGIGINLNPYVIQEGNCFRLLPIMNPNPRGEFISDDIMYENVMDKFAFRELDNPHVYYNEQYRNFVLNHRSTFNSLAVGLINDGDKERARLATLKNLEAMPDKAIPYDYTTSQTVGILFELGENEKAKEIGEILAERADNFLTYVEKYDKTFGDEKQKQIVILNELANNMRKNGENELADKYEELFRYHYERL